MKKLLMIGAAIAVAASVNAGDAGNGKTLSATCAGCHGADGNSAIATYPKLAGQNEKYIVNQLQAFKSGDRNNAMMAPMAAMLDEKGMQDVAAYYASQRTTHGDVDPKYVELGQKLYRGGDTDRDVAACIACHGAKGEGMPAAGFPALSGQHPEYIAAQLKAFRSGERKNKMMQDVTAKMSDQQIEALANYVSGLH